MSFRPFQFLKERVRIAADAAAGPVWRGGRRDVVAVLFEDGTIIDISPSAGVMIGEAGRFAGRSLFDFVHRNDRERIRECFSAIAKGADEARADFRLMRLRRGPASAAIYMRPVGRGRVEALIHEQIGTGQQEPSAQIETEGVNDLLADLTHELKTPLNAIMGFAEAMETETFGPLGHEKYGEYVAHIRESGAHLMELISVILDQAKIDAGRYALDAKLATPGAPARACADMIRVEAERAGLRFDVEIAPDLPEAIFDPRAVRQILLNLLSNAVKFTVAGAVTLRVTEHNGVIRYQVIDTGVGMDGATLSALGRRFTEVSKDGVRGTKGAGLGLSLAFALARLHGGEITFDSAPGEGATATFLLPVKKRLADLPSNPEAPAPVSDDIQSQFDRVNAFRRERAARAHQARAA